MTITSKENENIKHIKKLKEKKYREEYKEYFIEGLKLVAEAIEENVEIKTIIICDSCVESGEIDQKTLYKVAKYNCIYVDENVFKTITEVQTPQGILAVISNNIEEEHLQNINYIDDVIVVLDNINDPRKLRYNTKNNR